MKKRITCILLLLVTFFSMVVPVFAAEDSVSIVDSSIESDFYAADFDMDLYKDRYGYQDRIIGIREYGYTGTGKYDLYLYVYGPAFFTSTVYDFSIAVGNGSVKKWYTFDLVDISECKRFYKLKLSNIPATTFLNDGVRTYIFADGFDIRYQDPTLDYDEKYFSNTYDTFCFECTGTDKKGDYSIESNIQDLISLNVKSTVYRTPTSDKGVGYKYDVFSVYFSVPNKYFEQYEYLKSMDITYKETMWNAVVVNKGSTEKELADKLLGETFKEGEYNNEFASLYVNPSMLTGWAVGGLVGSQVYKTATYQLNNKSNFLFSESLSALTNVFAVDNYKDDDIFISGDKITGYLPYAENNDNYGLNFKTIEFDETFDIESFASGNKSNALYKKLVIWWYQYKNEVSLDNVDPIVSVDDSFFDGFTSDIEKWCGDHLIHPDDAEAFKDAYAEAKRKSETLVVLRFAVRDYYSAKAALDTGRKWTDVTNCFYAQGTAFLDFKVINLNFMKGGELYVVPTVHEAIDINGGITPPDDSILDDAVEGVEDWWKSIMEDYNNMLDSVMNVVRIMLILVFIVVLWQPVSALITFIKTKNNKKE